MATHLPASQFLGIPTTRLFGLLRAAQSGSGGSHTLLGLVGRLKRPVTTKAEAGSSSGEPVEQAAHGPRSRSLNLLFVYERQEDIDRILAALQGDGLQIRSNQAVSKNEFLQRLTPTPDAVISDYSLNGFSCLRALDLLQTLNLDIPLLLVSEPIGEEQVALAMKRGVDDFMLKDNLDRLGSSIMNALQNHQQRREVRFAAEAMQEREERFRSCIEQMPDAVALLSTLRTDDLSICGFHIDYLNPMAHRTVNFLGSVEVGGTVRAQDTQHLKDGLFSAWCQVVAYDQPAEREVLTLQPGIRPGSEGWLEQACDVRAVKMGDGLLLVWRDITEKKRAEEELGYLSTHDLLTGLFNRSSFEADLERLVKSRLYPVSVLMANVKGMKAANETLGYAGGDELLRRAAHLLVTAFRSEDMVARINGDEFGVLLPRTSAEAVEKALERVKALLAQQLAQNGRWPLSLSIGIATAEPGDDLPAAYHLAERRMYAEKGSRH